MRIHETQYLYRKTIGSKVSNLLGFIKINSKKNTIFIWDIDYTILGPNDNTFSMANVSRNRDIFIKHISKMSDEKRILFLNYLCYKVNTELVSPILKQIFYELSNTNTDTIGISSMHYGSLLDIKNCQKDRLDRLHSNGIYFSVPKNIEISPSDIFCHEGCIFTNSVLKEGKAFSLKKYLHTFYKNVKNIAYIDDNIDNYNELQIHLGDRYNINFFEFLHSYDPKEKLMESTHFELNLKEWIYAFDKKASYFSETI